MEYLRLLKSVFNSIFDYYLDFDRKNYFKLVFSILAIIAFTIISVLIASFIIEKITNPGTSIVEYINLRRGIINYVFNYKSIPISNFFILNLALLSSYFLSFTRKANDITIQETFRLISSKKWGYYLIFTFFICLTQLYKNPHFTINHDSWEFFLVDDYQYGSILIWLYDFIQLLILIIVVILSYFLTQKEKIKLSTFNKGEVRKVFIIVISIFLLRSLIISFFIGVNSYFGRIIELMHLEGILGMVLLIILVMAITLVIPAATIILSFNDKENNGSKPTITIQKNNEELLDESI